MEPRESLAIVPSFRAGSTITSVVKKLLGIVDFVLVVDDACPESSGNKVQKKYKGSDSVKVIFRAQNGGVGAAMKTGFDWALSQKFTYIVKVDADDQMDTSRIPEMIASIAKGEADIVKGNRFDSISDLEKMPIPRIIGNAGLSLIAKSSSGLWTINDPTNGFFVISRAALKAIQHQKLNDGFFFESDLLFRAGVASCKVSELAMPAIYGSEKSNLRISRVLLSFPLLHAKNTFKRIAYKYFVREWSLGTLNLIGATLMFILAVLLGLDALRLIQATGDPITAGQAVGVSLTAILGFQLLLAFLSYDVQMERRNGQRFPIS